MTDREKEIMDLIEKDPLVTQDALASKLGIQRSSVAVHISNLTKKGYIKGRGYIINASPYVVVIGGSNMDIIGTPLHPIREKDSNIGKVLTRSGGVGRNIAEALSRMSLHVNFISAVGNDSFGRTILNELTALGIEKQGVLVSDQMPTSTYLCINDHGGDMALAISQMDIAGMIDSNYLSQWDKKIEAATAIVLDTNLSQETLAYLMHKYYHKPIFIDPVSTAKAEKLIGLLSYIKFLKPNLIEAEILLGIKQTHLNAERTDDEIQYAMTLAKALVEKGVDEVALSLGDHGVVYSDGEQTRWFDNYKVEVMDTTGAGDAFFSGYIFRSLFGDDIEERMMYALGSAAFQISKKDAATRLTHEAVLQLMHAQSQ